MIPYTEQWQKITEAYMRDEIKPWDDKFCFCGTLAGNTNNWHNGWDEVDFGQYKAQHYDRMEMALLQKLSCRSFFLKPYREYENEVFEGMCDALEVLRQIHIEMGDPTAIDFGTPLQKRSLKTA